MGGATWATLEVATAQVKSMSERIAHTQVTIITHAQLNLPTMSNDLDFDVYRAACGGSVSMGDCGSRVAIITRSERVAVLQVAESQAQVFKAELGRQAREIGMLRALLKEREAGP